MQPNNNFNRFKTRHLYVLSLLFIAAYLGKPSLDRYLQYEYCMETLGDSKVCTMTYSIMSLFS